MSGKRKRTQNIDLDNEDSQPGPSTLARRLRRRDRQDYTRDGGISDISWDGDALSLEATSPSPSNRAYASSSVAQDFDFEHDLQSFPSWPNSEDGEDQLIGDEAYSMSSAGATAGTSFISPEEALSQADPPPMTQLSSTYSDGKVITSPSLAKILHPPNPGNTSPLPPLPKPSPSKSPIAGPSTILDTPRRPPPEPEPLSSYTCPICFFPPTNATLTTCGHICCGSCLFTAVKTTMARSINLGQNPVPLCPVCRAEIAGWDGKGGGVIGLKARVVYSL